MGVTGAQITVDPAMIEACVRDVLNIKAPRTMVVIDPIRVVIENFPPNQPTTISVPDFPAVPNSTSHNVAFEYVIFIDREDFKLVSPDLLDMHRCHRERYDEYE
jgi:glutaminyl-tRNA synthetase